MTEKERERVKEIISQANRLLKEWGIDDEIRIEEGRQAEWLWGKGWKFPEAIFTFDGKEIGVCRAPIIKTATGSGYVYSRLWGKRAWYYWKGARWINGVAIDFILAVKAFENYLYRFKSLNATYTYIDGDENDELVIRIWFCRPPESISIRIVSEQKGFLYIRDNLVREGNVNEIVRDVVKLVSLLTL